MTRSSRFAFALAFLVPSFAPLSAQESAAIFDAPLVVTDEYHRISDIIDLDSDGFEDAVGWWWKNIDYDEYKVTGWMNNGQGKLVETWSFFVDPNQGSETTEYTTATGFINADENKDFAISTANEIFLFLSSGSGLAPTVQKLSPSPGAAVVGLAFIDMNSNGRDDLVVGTESRLITYLNPAVGTVWTPVENMHTGSPGEYLDTGDVNGDGLIDLVHSSGARVKLYSTIDGNLSLLGSYVDEIPGTPRALFGDVTGDGMDDIILFSRTASLQQLLRRTGPNSFVREPVQPGGPATGLADINGDGVLDGVCCGGGGTPGIQNTKTSTFQLAINDGNGNFANSFENMIRGLGAESIAGATDLDHDGDVDLVAGRVVYYGRGNYEVPAPAPIGTGFHLPREAFDVDMDGDIDLEVGLGTGYMNLGNGEFVFAPSQVADPGNGRSFVGPGFPGDFDGDGDCDLVVQAMLNDSFESMALLLNDGSGGFVDGGSAGAPGVDFNYIQEVPNQADSSIAADIDGDGDLDLVVNLAELIGDGPASIVGAKFWINDGTGSFTAGPVLGRMLRAVEDYTGDGLPDICVLSAGGSQGNGLYKVMANHGNGNYGFNMGWGMNNVISPEVLIHFEDLDEDGTMDVMSPGYAGYGNGLGNFSGGVNLSGPLGVPEPGGAVHTVAVDYDGDGLTDAINGPVKYAEGVMTIARNLLGPEWQVGAAEQVMDATMAADVDGDGDMDLIADRVYFNMRADGSLGTDYCPVQPNSTGTGALIDAQGSLSVQSDNLTLYANSLPANVPGIFFYGATQVQLPFGDGYRCIGGSGLYRLPNTVSTSGGVLSSPVDLGAGQSGSGQIFAGSTWNFQAWFRDVSGGPAGFNLSNATELVFVP